MILMGDRSTVRFLVSGLSAERVKFGFLKDYAIRGKTPPSGHIGATDASFYEPK